MNTQEIINGLEEIKATSSGFEEGWLQDAINALKATQWLEIASAPKDGTRIIAYDPHSNIGVRECFWFEWNKEWIYMDIPDASE